MGLDVEDIKDHNGVYWYSIERVKQLKSVYRQDWQDTKQIEKPQQDLSDYFVHGKSKHTTKRDFKTKKEALNYEHEFKATAEERVDL